MKTCFLLIDDDKVINFVNKMLLSRCELTHDPKIFTEAREGLSFIENNVDDYDRFVILLDINMPDMDGWEFLDVVSDKNYKSKLVVFMLSSSLASEDEEKAYSYDLVQDFIHKPMTEARCNELKNHPGIKG